jgi:hypothetical protein
VRVAHLVGAAIKANPPRGGDAKPKGLDLSRGSRATEQGRRREMRPVGDSQPLSLEIEVLDGNDVPHSWVGRKVGVETVTAPGMVVGWLQSKSAWRLVIVEDRTGEPRYVPWVAVEAIFLLEEEPEGPMTRQEAKQVAGLGRHARSYRRVGLRAYERFLRGPVIVVLAVLWLGGFTLLGLCVFVLYLAGSMLMGVLRGA